MITNAESETPQTLRAAVFDYGGVMTYPMSTAAAGIVPEGLDPLAVRAAMSRIIDHSSPNTAWARIERGEMSLHEFGEVLDAELPGLSAVFSNVDTLPPSRLQVRDDMVEFVRNLRQRGIRTALCTNNIAEFRPIWTAKLDCGALFDCVIDSSAVGMRKPEPRMFELVESLVGVPASQSVFVDDIAVNTAAAAAAGFRAVLVGETDDHFAELRALFPSDCES